MFVGRSYEKSWRATIDASQPASEAEVRALAATLKKGKGPVASASAGAATAGSRASGAGASGAGAGGTSPPIDDGLLDKNIEVCFSIITYKERGKKATTENFWCPGSIESVSDESTVLGRKKLGCGWVFICELQRWRGGLATSSPHLLHSMRRSPVVGELSRARQS